MEVTSHAITVVGCGPGSRACLTQEAIEAVAASEVLIGARRLLDLFPDTRAELIALQGSAVEVNAAIAARPGRRIAVLVSGDPGVASLARLLVRDHGRDACRIVPGLSSVQVAFARIGADWTSARIISAHAVLPIPAVEMLKAEAAIAVLLGASGAGEWVATLAERLGSQYRLWIAEDLTLPGESVREVTPADLRALTGAALRIAILIARQS